jgi:hypothetical protein
MNPVTDLANALAALKLKRPRFVSVREGTEIHTPGKPVLLLTWPAVQQFAQDREEAENG